MKRVLVVGEDALNCALGERLVESAMPGWSLAALPINKRGVTKLVRDLPRYVAQARYVQPVVCIADTDGNCVKDLLADWSLTSPPETFHLRLAVKEAESWVLADRDCFARHFKVPLNKVPCQTDDIEDPKRLLLQLVSKSHVREYRDEMISSTDRSKTGRGYNLHLCTFVRDTWGARQASAGSLSLKRSLARLDSFAKSYE